MANYTTMLGLWYGAPQIPTVGFNHWVIRNQDWEIFLKYMYEEDEGINIILIIGIKTGVIEKDSVLIWRTWRWEEVSSIS